MKKISNEIECQVIDMYVNYRSGTTQISQALKISTAAAIKILKRNNVARRSRSECMTGVIIGSKLPIDDIIQKYTVDKLSAEEISKAIGFSRRAVLNVLHKNNISIRPNGWTEAIHPNESDIIYEYKNGLGMNIIAKNMNLTYGVVRSVLNKHRLIRTDDWQKGCVGNRNGKYGKKCSSTQLNKFYLTKTGMDFESYIKKLPLFQRYRKLVTKITNQQDLKKLKNFENRGKKKFHLDHKFSVIEGFKQNINPELIGNIKNLEMVQYDKNISKGGACSITLEELIISTENKIFTYLI